MTAILLTVLQSSNCLRTALSGYSTGGYLIFEGKVYLIVLPLSVFIPGLLVVIFWIKILVVELMRAIGSSSQQKIERNLVHSSLKASVVDDSWA